MEGVQGEGGGLRGSTCVVPHCTVCAMLRCSVCAAMLYTLMCTALHCTALCVLCFTAPYCALPCAACAVLHRTRPCSVVHRLCCAAPHCWRYTARHNTALRCTVRAVLRSRCVAHIACTMLHCTVLCAPCCSATHCTALRCTIGASNGVAHHLHARRPRRRGQPGGPLLAGCLYRRLARHNTALRCTVRAVLRSRCVAQIARTMLHCTVLCAPCCSATHCTALRCTIGASDGVAHHLHARRPRRRGQPGGPLLAGCLCRRLARHKPHERHSTY